MRRASPVVGIGLLAAWLAVGGCSDDGLAPHSEHRIVTLETISAGNERREIVDGIRVLGWEDLVPERFHAGEYFAAPEVRELDDGDPRAAAPARELSPEPAAAPVVDALDGETVRLPGFVIPLEGRGDRVEEFLLVPYYGACIHVPPPPANQVVHVLAQGREVRIRRLFDTVWVTGVIRVEPVSSRLAEAGYRLHVIEVSPYDG